MFMARSTISGNKTIVKNTIFLYIRMIFLMLVSLYTVRVVLNILGEVNYGIYSAIGGIVITFSFLTQTLVSASQRFFAVELGREDKIELNKTYNAIFFSYIIIAAIIVLLLETVGLWFVQNKMTIPDDRVSAALVLFQFSIFTFIFHILVNPYISIIIAQEDMRTYAYISILEVVLKLGVAFSLIFISYDKLRLYGILLFVVEVIIFFIYSAISKKRYNYVYFNKKIDKKKLKEIFTFSSWSLFGSMAGVANGQCINVMLNVFYGPIANAAYAIGHQVSVVLGQVTNNFCSAVRPPMIKSYAIGDIAKTSELFYFSSKILIVLMLVIMVPMYYEIEYLLALWLGDVEQYMVSFSRLLLINIAILCIGNPITTIVQAAGVVKKYHVLVDGFALLSLPIVYIAFKMDCEPEIAFIISNIVFVVAHIIRLVILKSVIPFSYMEYSCRLIFPTGLITVISSIVAYMVGNSMLNDVLKLLSVVVSSVIVIIILSLYLLLSKYERKQIIALIISKISCQNGA